MTLQSTDMTQITAPTRRRPPFSWTRLSYVAATLALIAGTGVLEGYELYLASSILAYAIAAMGLNVLMGYNGQISLGHGAFFAIGAYTAAICIDRFTVPFALTPIIAGVAGMGAGWLIGKPALRLEGVYLALATFGLAIATPTVLRSDLFSEWTGGVQGLFLLINPAPDWAGLDLDQSIYVAVVAYFLLFAFLTLRLVRGLNGKAWIATRDNPIAARAMGFDVTRAKTRAFVFSVLACSVGGALQAVAVQFVAPDSFPFFLSISLFTAVVVGGLCSPLVGPLLGAVFIVMVPNVTEEIWQGGNWAIYGGVIIAIVGIQPRGLAGMLAWIRDKITTHATER
ncbi:branched-chain amino acid ABC transporter permease [Roseovarius sp. CAU 1744]|uniref:branched-chain amino acid ABC transporter permease n=1 Tax=Roseovarius sp. CAU 1744 TaxID=3140368 RepID=UPI00325A802F